MIRLGIAALVLAGVAILRAPAAFAQAADPPKYRFDAGIGSLWVGQEPLGSTTASEATAAGGTRPLFNSSSDLASAAGAAGWIGVRVTRSLVVEADASYSKPELRIAISGDAEGAADVTATETVEQFAIGAGVLWYAPHRRLPARFAPFAMAGAGYLRQLHDRATLVATGRFYQVGGGATYLLVSSPHFHTKGIGARVDVRAFIRSEGVAFDGGSKASPAIGLSAFVRF